MPVGIASTVLGKNRLPELFRAGVEIGTEGLELACAGDSDVKALYRARYPAKLRELSRGGNLTIPSMSLGVLCKRPGLIGNEEQSAPGREIVSQAISVAAEAGINTVVVPFFGKNAIEIEDELTRAADSLLGLADHAEDAGVVLAVESTLNFDQREFLLDHVGNSGAVKICLNTAITLGRKMDLPTGIRDLGPEAIAQVHFKDVRLTEARPPDYNVHLGEGDVDFLATANALRAVGWDGWVIVDTPPGDDPIAAGRENVGFARNVLASPE